MNKIINFHDIHDADWFEQVLTILKNKYNLISIHELESYYCEGKQFNNACHITVDDGDIAFYKSMYPILKKMKVPASLFVSPEICIDEKNFWFQEIRNFNPIDFKLIISKYLQIDFNFLSPYPLTVILKNLKIEEIWELIDLYKNQFHVGESNAQNLNVEQLIEIDREGLVVIGAHTNNHPILANENDEKSKKEIIKSFDGLKQLLGHDIHYFAFPNGTPDLDFNQREVDTLKSINCRIAFTTQPKNFTKKDAPLCIPRFGFSFGNKYFIKTKLFLGEYWEHTKNLKGISEKNIRIKLKSKLLRMRYCETHKRNQPDSVLSGD